MKEKFVLGEYVIQFKSVLEVPEISKAFYNFLKLEYATDNWDFILEVNNLQHFSKIKNNQISTIKKVKTICSTYVQPGSPKEILVGATLKKKILSQVEKLADKGWNLELSPPELFEPLKNLLILEYKNDSFLRFSRDPTCLKLLEKYKGNRNVLLPQLSMVYNYKDEDFESNSIEEKDKEFLERFALDNPNWQLVHSNKNTKCCAFKSTWNYFPNISFLTPTIENVKYQMFFDYSLQEVACAVFSKYHENDPVAVQAKVIDYKPQKHVIVQQTSQIDQGQGSFFKRLVYTVDYDPEKKKLTSKAKPTRVPGRSFFKQSKMGKQYFTFYINVLTELDEKRTLFEQVIALDVGGIGFTNTMIEKRCNAMYTKYLKNLKELEGNKISDLGKQLNISSEGIPDQPLFQLICDLDIDRMNEEYQMKLEKRRKVFELNKFDVKFTALRRQEIQDAYYTFLKKEHNTDSWDFLKQYIVLLKLVEKKDEKKIQLALKEIIKTYFERRSAKNLSLSDEEMTMIIESQNDVTTCIGRLKKIFGVIKMEHSMNSFKSFLKSAEALSILPKYQHDIEVMTPILKFVSTYKNEDFQPQITENDVKFSLDLAENASSWDFLHSSECSTISVSKVNWFQNCTFINPNSMTSYEFKYIFEYPIEQIANGYIRITDIETSDSTLDTVKYVKMNNETNENYPSVIMNSVVNWDKDDRMIKENVFSCFTHHNSLIFINKPIQPDDQNWFKKDNGTTRYFQYEIVVMKRNDPKQVSVQHILCINSNVKMDWDKIMIEKCKSFYNTLDAIISNSSSKISDMQELYSEKENGEWKHPLGKLLLDINFDSLTEIEEIEKFESIPNESSNIETDEYALLSSIDQIQ